MSDPSTSSNIKFIYDLPFKERSDLCRILNQSDKWEELAGKGMMYDMLTIQSLRKEKNPTDELFNNWSNYNHTITELYVLLSHMQHYRAMLILKKFVDEKFHILIEEGEGRLHPDLDRKQVKKNAKDLKIGIQNFNMITPQRIVLPKIDKLKIEEHRRAGDAANKVLNQAGLVIPQLQVPSNSNNLLAVTPPPKTSPIPKRNSKPSNKESLLAFLKETTLPQIPYEDLAQATDYWNKKRLLGKGGFGEVYKGVVRNTDVAIKKIERRGPKCNDSYMRQLQQSLTEITILQSRPHENILTLYSFSIEGDAPCLVYQLMANGSLEDRLQLKHQTKPLVWLQRHEIAKGTARGLQYLHTIGKKPLIHGDIKSANILLDVNFHPRIGDFGLAREGLENDDMQVSRVQGTRPYLPDDFLLSKILSTKVDTYCFGIVMFELATGKRAYEKSRPHDFLKKHIDSIDENKHDLLIDRKAGEVNAGFFKKLMILGRWCTNTLPDDRPEMTIVFRELDHKS